MYNRHYCTIIGLITSCRMCLFSYAFLYCKIWQLITYNPSILEKKPIFFAMVFCSLFFFNRYYKIKLLSYLASITLNFLFPYTAFADRDILGWTWECTPWIIFVVFKAIFTWRYEKKYIYYLLFFFSAHRTHLFKFFHLMCKVVIYNYFVLVLISWKKVL